MVFTSLTMDLSLALPLRKGILFHSWFVSITDSMALRRPSDLRELPSLVPERVKNATAYAVAGELDRRIENLAKILDTGSTDPDSSSNGRSLAMFCSGFSDHRL